MLIGIDASRAVATQRTGTEAYAYFLIHALIQATAAGSHRLRLYFNQPPPPDLLPDLPHVERKVMPWPRLWTHVRLARELLQSPPDVFYTPAHVIPFLHRGAGVATVHDLGYHFFPEAHTRSQVAYLKLSTRMNGRLSKLVVADSQATKQDLRHFYGIASEKIRVVYPAIDPQLARVEDGARIRSVCREYGISLPYLLYIGTLQPRKNLVRLVRAFERANLPFQLLLGGKLGWRADALFAAIAALDAGVRERILLPGYIPEEDKGALLSGAAALVFPSLYEGFGFPVIEAQMCRTPVLASNSSSLPEITAGSALLVDPLSVEELAHGMRRISLDDELRRELIRKGSRNARRFDWQETAAHVLEVLETAAAM